MLIDLRPIPVALQKDFELYLAEERERGARDAALLAVALYLAFGILDIWAIPGALFQVWTIRLLVAGFLLGFYRFTRSPLFLRHYAASMSLFFLVLGLGIELMIFLAGDHDIARLAYHTGLILVIMGLHLWSLLPAWQNAVIGALLALVYIFIALTIHDMGAAGQWRLLLSNCFFLVSANVVGYFGSLGRERYLRDGFLLRHDLVTDLERIAIEKKWAAYWSEHDPLTGLPNRRRLMRRLESWMAPGSGAQTFALLFIDLDGFKHINDRLGHGMGDEVLKVIGGRIRHCVRKGDLVARLGGDEFVVVLRLGQRDDALVERIARTIIARIEEPVREPAVDLPLSASIGVAYYPDHARDAETLIEAADQWMYVSKGRGRGQLTFAPA